jgi:hypothetical protein
MIQEPTTNEEKMSFQKEKQRDKISYKLQMESKKHWEVIDSLLNSFNVT